MDYIRDKEWYSFQTGCFGFGFFLFACFNTIYIDSTTGACCGWVFVCNTVIVWIGKLVDLIGNRDFNWLVQTMWIFCFANFTQRRNVVVFYLINWFDLIIGLLLTHTTFHWHFFHFIQVLVQVHNLCAVFCFVFTSYT